jgi:hypothetical protein
MDANLVALNTDKVEWSADGLSLLKKDASGNILTFTADGNIVANVNHRHGAYDTLRTVLGGNGEVSLMDDRKGLFLHDGAGNPRPLYGGRLVAAFFSNYGNMIASGTTGAVLQHSKIQDTVANPIPNEFTIDGTAKHFSLIPGIRVYEARWSFQALGTLPATVKFAVELSTDGGATFSTDASVGPVSAYIPANGGGGFASLMFFPLEGSGVTHFRFRAYQDGGSNMLLIASTILSART